MDERAEPPRRRPEAVSDKELLARHVQGDSGAFAELVRRHRDRMWAVALRRLGDPEEAADALQEAFLTAYRTADRLRDDALVSGWLRLLVVNACFHRLGRQSFPGGPAVRRLDEPTHEMDHVSATQRLNLLADLESIRSKNQMQRLLSWLSSATSAPHSVYRPQPSSNRFAIHASSGGHSTDLQALRNLRNRIAHGHAADSLALLQDQHNINQDFASAVILILAQQRPDLLVKAAHDLFSDHTRQVNRSSRSYLLLLTIMRDAVQHVKRAPDADGDATARTTHYEERQPDD